MSETARNAAVGQYIATAVTVTTGHGYVELGFEFIAAADGVFDHQRIGVKAVALFNAPAIAGRNIVSGRVAALVGVHGVARAVGRDPGVHKQAAGSHIRLGVGRFDGVQEGDAIMRRGDAFALAGFGGCRALLNFCVIGLRVAAQGVAEVMRQREAGQFD